MGPLRVVASQPTPNIVVAPQVQQQLPNLRVVGPVYNPAPGTYQDNVGRTWTPTSFNFMQGLAGMLNSILHPGREFENSGIQLQQNAQPMIANPSHSVGGYLSRDIIGPTLQSYGQTEQHGGQLMQGQNPYAGLTIPQTIGSMGMDALNIASLIPGAQTLKLGGLAAEQGLKGAAARIGQQALTNAAYGAGYGASGALQQKGVTVGDVLKSAAMGAGVGGATAGVMGVAGAGVGKGIRIASGANKALGTSGSADLGAQLGHDYQAASDHADQMLQQHGYDSKEFMTASDRAAKLQTKVMAANAPVTPAQFRDVLNQRFGTDTGVGRQSWNAQSGARTRAYGDWLYNSDRGMFNQAYQEHLDSLARGAGEGGFAKLTQPIGPDPNDPLAKYATTPEAQKSLTKLQQAEAENKRLTDQQENPGGVVVGKAGKLTKPVKVNPQANVDQATATATQMTAPDASKAALEAANAKTKADFERIFGPVSDQPTEGASMREANAEAGSGPRSQGKLNKQLAQAEQEDAATAKAIKQQRGAPAPLSLPAADNRDQAALNAQAATGMIQQRANDAIAAAMKLDSHDHALMDDLRTTAPNKLAAQAHDPQAFMDAANKAKAYNDFTFSLGTGGGEAYNYRPNYGASQLWDRSDAKTADLLKQYEEAQLGKAGYTKERVLPDYKTGEKLGMKRLNENFAQDLATDAATRQSKIAESYLAKGLEQAFPGQVAVGNIPRGWKPLTVAHGQYISMPGEIADQINRRGIPKTVYNPMLKAYDAANRGIKYFSLGGGLFHLNTTASTVLGQQLMSGKFLTDFKGNMRLIGDTLSKTANEKHMAEWASDAADHVDGRSTIDRAQIAGVTLRPEKIAADINVNFVDKLKTNNPVSWTIKQMHDMVFQRQIPEAKLMMFKQMTNGLDTGKPEDLAIMRDAAKAVNKLGGINSAVEGLTPQAAKNLARVVLATDYSQAKVLKVMAAVSKPIGNVYGDTARQMIVGKALVTAIPGMIAALAAGKLTSPQAWGQEFLNQILDPQVATSYTDDKGRPEVARLPTSEISEIGRVIMPLFTDKANPISGLEHWLVARTSAAGSLASELITGQTYYGKSIYAKDANGNIDYGKTAENLAVSKLPIPISQGIQIAQGTVKPGEAALNVAGLRVSGTPGPLDQKPNANTPNDKALQTAQQTYDNAKAALDAAGGLSGDKTTPQYKAFTAAQTALKKAQVGASQRLGGTPTLDAAQARIDNVQKTFNANLPQAAKDIMTRYAKLNSNGQAAFNSDPNNTYNLHLAQYENNKLNGKLTPVADYNARLALAKENVQRQYSTDVQSLYGMSKTNLTRLAAMNPAVAQLLPQLYQMDAAMASTGLEMPKYHDKFGNLKPISTDGSTGSTKVAKAKLPKISLKTPKIAAPPTVKMAKAKGLKLTTFKVAKIKTPKIKVV